MSNLIRFLLIDCSMAICVTLDLLWTIRTGRARTWAGAATREQQSKRYWRHIYENYAILALFGAAFLGALLFAQSLQT
jgi:hypothetical protein